MDSRGEVVQSIALSSMDASYSVPPGVRLLSEGKSVVMWL